MVRKNEPRNYTYGEIFSNGGTAICALSLVTKDDSNDVKKLAKIHFNIDEFGRSQAAKCCYIHTAKRDIKKNTSGGIVYKYSDNLLPEHIKWIDTYKNIIKNREIDHYIIDNEFIEIYDIAMLTLQMYRCANIDYDINSKLLLDEMTSDIINVIPNDSYRIPLLPPQDIFPQNQNDDDQRIIESD